MSYEHPASSFSNVRLHFAMKKQKTKGCEEVAQIILNCRAGEDVFKTFARRTTQFSFFCERMKSCRIQVTSSLQREKN